jgi:hypothetical protein
MKTPTVGLFFVAKKDGTLRLIFDTRCVNELFVDPETVTLPTAGVWTGLRVEPGDSLNLAQVEVEAAFYRIKSPPGLQEYFVLPPVHLPTLRRIRPDLCVDWAITDEWAGPRLCVLAMGWSWSLYFCQELLECMVERSGFPRDKQIRNRHVVPPITTTPAAATYVDGVAVISGQPAPALAGVARVKNNLDSVGLSCKPADEPELEQVFTGLTFHRDTGRITVARGRIWRLRLGLHQLAKRGFATGEEIGRVLGHFTWACLVRRCLLSIFQATYRFARLAGRHRWRLWPSVIAELL